MIEDSFPFYLILIIVIVLLIMLANRIRVAYPVLLVVGGLLISFLPWVPAMHIDPDLVFLIFLPPLLYEASWVISWKELWRWRRIIISFAFIVVLLTALSVAFVANAFIPGFSLALGFVLGGIVSPPDAVSAGAILRFVKVPKRVSSILEGESLLNDASSLIVFRFAMIAVGTGQFIWYQAAGSFAWMVLGGCAIGLIVGWIFMIAHKYLPTTYNTDVVLTLVTPYIMYLTAEKLHTSGVLAVVCGGLLQSYYRNRFLQSGARLRGINVWESLVFVLNGIIFMMIGLDLPEIVSGLEDVSLSAAIGYGLLITAVLIVGRIIAAYGAVIVTLIMRNFITVADKRSPGFRTPLLLGWTGMRGVVSLAAALSIRVHLSNGAPFPHRNLIIFITFVVLLTTLLLQGLTLPWLIRKIPLPEFGDYLQEDEANEFVNQELAKVALSHIDQKYPDIDHPMIHVLSEKWNAHSSGTVEANIPEDIRQAYLDLLEQQRKWLLDHNNFKDKLDDAVVRKHLYKIDLEEEKLRLS